MSPLVSLEGKVIVLIGGTSGIGLSAARACLVAGASLSIIGLATDERIEAEMGSRAVVRFVDATQQGAAEDAIRIAREKFGGFHGLYHVAGGSGRAYGDGALDQLTDGGWDFTLRLNLTSAMCSARAAVRAFTQSNTSGSVVMLSSVLARHPAPQHFGTVAYATTKAAIEGMAAASASAYAKRRIRFNCIAPGLVATPMSRRAQENPAVLEYARHRQPLGEGIGAVSDLDGAAVFLLSDASRWITGQVIAVDGGWGVSDAAV